MELSTTMKQSNGYILLLRQRYDKNSSLHKCSFSSVSFHAKKRRTGQKVGGQEWFLVLVYWCLIDFHCRINQSETSTVLCCLAKITRSAGSTSTKNSNAQEICFPYSKYCMYIYLFCSHTFRFHKITIS